MKENLPKRTDLKTLVLSPTIFADSPASFVFSNKISENNWQNKRGKDYDEISGLWPEAEKGNMDAISNLYEIYYPRIYGFIYNRLGNNKNGVVDDLTQETFLKAFANHHTYEYRDKNKTPFRPWLFRIAHNAIIDHIRRVSKHNGDVAVDEIRDRKRSFADTSLDRMILIEAISTLGEYQRKIFVLHYVEGIPYEDIASQLGKTNGSLREVAHSARKNIKKYLKEIGYSLGI